MSVKSTWVALCIFLVMFGGIGAAKLSGYWNTELSGASAVNEQRGCSGKHYKQHKKGPALSAVANRKDDKLSGQYKDGTFAGTGVGYCSEINVEITVEGNKITAVEVIGHDETPGYYEEAVDRVPQMIMYAQSVQVDHITGATFTSEGIKEAVNEALAKAQKN